MLGGTQGSGGVRHPVDGQVARSAPHLAGPSPNHPQDVPIPHMRHPPLDGVNVGEVPPLGVVGNVNTEDVHPHGVTSNKLFEMVLNIHFTTVSWEEMQNITKSLNRWWRRMEDRHRRS